LDESVVGNPYRLDADTLSEAEDEALSLPKPEGANFTKLARIADLVEQEIGFDL